MADVQTKLEPKLVTWVPPRGGVVHMRLTVAFTNSLLFGTEGIGWIRGRHDANSEQVLACRAARALLR